MLQHGRHRQRGYCVTNTHTYTSTYTYTYTCSHPYPNSGCYNQSGD